MIIERENNVPIIKNKLNRHVLDKYEKEKILESVPLIDKVLEENSVSTFDIITLLRRNYKNSLLDAYNSISISEFGQSKFNCLYLARLLKEELKQLDINAQYLSYQARKYAFDIGDKKIKEAHISLIYPTLDGDDVKYTIFDPGLKIHLPITFTEKNEYEIHLNQYQNIKITYDESINDYAYAIEMYGISPYSYTNYPHLVYQRFNPNYLIQNVEDILCPISLKLLTGYKTTIFSKFLDNRAYIRLDHLDKSLEYCDYKDGIIHTFSYSELMKNGRNSLIFKLQPICEKLKIDVNELVDDIFFMIDINDEFINQIMDNDVLQEYKKVKKIK